MYGRCYYFEPYRNEPYIIEQLLQMSETVVNDLAMKIGVHKEYSHARKILEGIIPILADLIDAPRSATYEEILEFICEEAAKKIKLNRFQIYTLPGMIEKIQANYQVTPQTILQKWYAMPLKNDLFRKAFKDQILEEVITKMFQVKNSSSN